MRNPVFTDDVHCGWGVLDQGGRLKFDAIMHLVMDGYGRAHKAWGYGESRGEYFATTGLSPVTTYLEISRAPHRLKVDDPLAVHFSGEYGFVAGPGGKPPRQGGRDRIEVTDEDGTTIASWRQHWLWHRRATGELLSEPPPGSKGGEIQLTEPPPRPRLDAASNPRPFRWTPRETDMNQHVNVAGYLERGENALADEGVDVWDINSVRLWFRRPAFLDDLMLAHADGASDPRIVEIRRADPEELCATLAFSG